VRFSPYRITAGVFTPAVMYFFALKKSGGLPQ
jgi:hypothetical protein